MNKIFAYGLVIFALSAASACSNNYGEELESKLANLTPDKKQEALAAQCKEQIMKRLDLNNPASVTHSQHMQAICEQMTGQKLDIKYRSD